MEHLVFSPAVSISLSDEFDVVDAVVTVSLWDGVGEAMFLSWCTLTEKYKNKIFEMIKLQSTISFWTCTLSFSLTK